MSTHVVNRAYSQGRLDRIATLDLGQRNPLLQIYVIVLMRRHRAALPHWCYGNRTSTADSASPVVPVLGLPRIGRSRQAQRRLSVGMGTGLAEGGWFWARGGWDMGGIQIWPEGQIQSLFRRSRSTDPILSKLLFSRCRAE